MKYRKKPVVIEAFQVKAHLVIPEWFRDAISEGNARRRPQAPNHRDLIHPET